MKLEKIKIHNLFQYEDLEIPFTGNLIGVVGHNGCLAHGTPVKLPDGTTKNVEDLQSGDVILTFDDSTRQLTSGTVYEIIRTSHKPKPMMEITINGEKTCTTYDHPFFAGDGFYPLYQLAWGALEECQRTQLKLLCKQYGAPFDNKTIWQQNSGRNEAGSRPNGVLQDHAEWAYSESAQDRGGKLVGKPVWTASREPYRLQSYEQSGGKPGMVHGKVQCVVWGNPWENSGTPQTGVDIGGAEAAQENMERAAENLSLSHSGGKIEASSGTRNEIARPGSQKSFSAGNNGTGLRIKILGAAPYYTVRMREAPYAYCIGRRNCYLVHNSGKSNFLNSLHFAFAGEVPGKTKEQVLRWGSDEGYAIIEFNHAGKHGRIERRTPGTKASFKYGDEKAITGIRQVNEAVLDMLGMDKDVFRLVFVKQAELDTILFDQASRREVAFQRMCGLGEANRLYKNLSDLIAKVFNESDGDVEVAIATLNQEKENSEKELADVEKSLSVLGAEVMRYGPAQEAIEECNKWKAAARLKFAMQQTNASLAEKISTCENLKAELAKFADSVVGETVAANARLALQEEETKLREAEISEKAIAERQQRVSDNKLTVNSVMAESEAYKNLDALEAEADAEARKLAEGRALADLYKAAIEAVSISSYPVCPLCGQAFPPDLTKTFEEKLKSCHTDGSHFQIMIERLNAQKKKASELSGKLSTLIEMIDSDSKWLADHPSIGSDNLNAMRANFNDMREFVNEMQEKLNQAKQLEWKIHQMESDIGAMKAEYSSNQFDLQQLHVPEEMSYAEAEAKSKEADEHLEYFNKKMSEKNAALSVKISLERRIIGIKQSLEDAARRLAQSETRETAYRTLGKVADWLHYSNGPHKLAQRIMQDLTDDTNKFLEILGAPFSVSIDPDTLGYLFSMNDGSGPDTPMPAEALSGGQKVLLAVAFRLASYCMFAGKYGLLSLDEPTAYLDDANIANFCTLLEAVKSTAVSMDLQILISTHERSVLPYMDSVLDIDAEKA